jgi:hypothetical protein
MLVAHCRFECLCRVGVAGGSVRIEMFSTAIPYIVGAHLPSTGSCRCGVELKSRSSAICRRCPVVARGTQSLEGAETARIAAQLSKRLIRHSEQRCSVRHQARTYLPTPGTRVSASPCEQAPLGARRPPFPDSCCGCDPPDDICPIEHRMWQKDDGLEISCNCMMLQISSSNPAQYRMIRTDTCALSE